MMRKFLTNDALLALLLGALLVVSCVLVLNFACQSTMEGIDWQEETYHVKRGDTLWEISSRYCPETVDTREWIEEVKTLNGMTDSTIYPGQVLVVLTPTK